MIKSALANLILHYQIVLKTTIDGDSVFGLQFTFSLFLSQRKITQVLILVGPLKTIAIRLAIFE